MNRTTAGRGFCKKLALGFWLAAATAVGLPAHSIAQPAEAAAPRGAQLLNSERIAEQFGSYGIEVLEPGAEIRVSNLYSENGGRKICRTFAVVRYPADVNPSFAAEHDLILDGESIGAVFAAHGWTVVKSHRHYTDVAATSKLGALMRTSAGAPLAVHVYVLEIVKSAARFEYATIVEVHHPDYLTRQDLTAIYGPLPAAAPDAATAEMLRIAADKMGR